MSFYSLENRVFSSEFNYIDFKGKDVQNLVLSKYQSGDGSTKIFRDLNGSVSLRQLDGGAKL